MRHLTYRVETEVETDGRWIAEIPDLPGGWLTVQRSRKRLRRHRPLHFVS